jgi:hypothetical protein
MLYKFFTFWVVFLVLGNKYTYKYVNLEYLTFITLLIGLYLSYINPGYYRFKLLDKWYEIRNTCEKFILVDLLFHILTFYYVYKIYRNEYIKLDKRIVISLLLIMIYYILIDIEKIYNISEKELMGVFVIVNIIYLLFL